MAGDYQAKDDQMIKYLGKVQRLIEKLGKVQVNYVPREANKRADELVGNNLLGRCCNTWTKG